MGLLEKFHPFLANVDYQDAFNKFVCVAISVLFLNILYILSAVLFWSVSASYRGLKQKKKVYWNLSIVRGIFGLYCTVIGAWVIFFDDELLEDPALATNSTSCFAILTGTGFFFFECGSLIVFDLHKNISTLLCVHHWSALFGFCVMAYLDMGHFFGTILLLLEMSAPYSAFCWILIKVGRGHTLLWKANQFLLVHTFHIRSMVECYLCFQIYLKYDKILSSTSNLTFAILLAEVALFTFLLTPYWLYKRTQQMFIPVDWNFNENDRQHEMNGECKKDS